MPLDASTIDLCLSVFPWALFRFTKSAVKLHTLLDLRGNIPTFIHISDGKLHDVNVLDILLPESGALYIMDRGYVDFERLFALHMAGSFFVIRTKSNTKYKRRYSHSVDKSGGVRCDQTIVLTGVKSVHDYPQPLRRVKYHDAQTGRTFNFLTNNFAIPAQTVADLYRYRGRSSCSSNGSSSTFASSRSSGPPRMRSRARFGSPSPFTFSWLIKKRLDIDADLYTIFQVLSLTLFEKILLLQLVTGAESICGDTEMSNQLNLFDKSSGQ